MMSDHHHHAAHNNNDNNADDDDAVVTTPTPEPFAGPMGNPWGDMPPATIDMPPAATSGAPAPSPPPQPPQPQVVAGPLYHHHHQDHPTTTTTNNNNNVPSTTAAAADDDPTKRLATLLSQSQAFADAVAQGSVKRAIDCVVHEARPLLLGSPPGEPSGAPPPPPRQDATNFPLPLHNFPDVPDNFPDLGPVGGLPVGFNMDPFGVDLMLTNLGGGSGSGGGGGPADGNGHHHHHQSRASPPAGGAGTRDPGFHPGNGNGAAAMAVEASGGGATTAEGIAREVQGKVSRIRETLLGLEYRACASFACMQKQWGGQRLSWRINVKKARNFTDLLGKLRELRKAMAPAGPRTVRAQELDHTLTRIAPSNITGTKLGGLVKELEIFMAKNFSQPGDPLSVPPRMKQEVARIVRAVEETRSQGVEAFLGLPLQQIFAKHPQVAQSLRALLQKQKLEVVSKLAALNARGDLADAQGGTTAMVGHQGGPGGSMGGHQEDEEDLATDMSDSE